MKLSLRNIPVIILVALFAINPVMAGLAAAQSCVGHMCCVSHPDMDNHGPKGHVIQAKRICCCSPASPTPCALNQRRAPDSDWVVSSHVRVVIHGSDAVASFTAPIDVLATPNNYSGTNDFFLSRSLSPPIYLANQTLIC